MTLCRVGAFLVGNGTSPADSGNSMNPKVYAEVETIPEIITVEACGEWRAELDCELWSRERPVWEVVVVEENMAGAGRPVGGGRGREPWRTQGPRVSPGSPAENLPGGAHGACVTVTVNLPEQMPCSLCLLPARGEGLAGPGASFFQSLRDLSHLSFAKGVVFFHL